MAEWWLGPTTADQCGHIPANVLTCSMTGSGLFVTSRENRPSSAPSRTYCTEGGRREGI